MPKLRPKKPKKPKCECARPKMVEYSYESYGQIYHFHRCENCRAEWTIQGVLIDRGVVSAEEIIDVHQLLQGDVSLETILKRPAP